MELPNSGDSRPDISAENSGSGCQYLGPGDGNLNVVSGNGGQYNDHSDRRQFTTTFAFNMPTDVPGIPSVWNLAEGLEGSGKEPTEPTRSILVDWLMRQPEHSPLDSSRHHLEIINQITPKTGTWILSTKEIQKWRDASNSSHRCLGIHGILGSGKTVLASLIIDTLRNEIKQDKDAACIYFYFHEGDDRSPPVARIWSTLLGQLLQHEGPKGVAEALKSKFNNSFRGSAPIHPLEYLKLFKAQASTFKTVYLVIDALDICTNGDDERTRHSIHQALKKLPHNIRVLFTSRSDSLTRDLGVSQKLQVTPNQSDIETYVKDRIDGDSVLHRVLEDTKHREDVVSRVSELTKTGGMFLLARLHMDNLSKQGTLADIKDALRRLPATSSLAFEASIRRILRTDNAFESDLAKHVLTWVVHAKVGLTMNQVGDSFAIYKSKGYRYHPESRPPKDSLMASCAGLVVEDHETNTLRLVHESVQTHLRKHQVIPGYADLEMAKTCLISLLMDETWHFHSPLLTYSVAHWFSHLGQSTDAQVQKLVKVFLGDSNSLTRAFRVMPEMSGSTCGGITGLHAAVYFNRLTWIKHLLKTGIDINSQCSNGQTALHWAAIHGRYYLLEYLIRKSADTNIRDRTGDTALHKILMGPTPEALPAVQALIHGGARIDIKGGKGLTPLSSAIRYGPTSIALFLIKSQADVDVEVTKGWTSLREVFYHGHEMIQGLGKGTGVNSDSSPDGWTPLRDAVKDHARCLIRLLLERGVDLNRRTTDGWLPLVHAVKAGSLVALQYLLEREPNPVDANQRDPDGKSALYWAFCYERYPAVKLLIEHGADVNEKNVDGWTPLIEAVRNRNEDIVWLLIKMGAQVDQTDSKGWSPLLYAIENQSKNMVWLLIANKANVKPRSINAPSAIHLALKKAQYSVAWLLCEHGADINGLDDKGMTLLHRACHGGRLKEVAFLLENGAETRSKDTAGFTALHYAVLRGWDEIVGLLASWGSVRGIIDEPDAKGNRAVMLATLRKSEAMVQALIDNGASCEDRDLTGLTPLHHAARLGFNKGLELLINEVGDVDLTDRKGFTAVHHAINSGMANADTIKLLKAGGADLEVQEHDGLTPLMLAVHLGRPSLTRQLLIQGANVHAKNGKGWTAMRLANASTSDHSTAKRILERALQGRLLGEY
ncbi:hypothetical protein BHE90_003759 [Fusarium euwallaceae]|uniref:Nephrocystin 3-like N-terminal domain-containing protein n=1 Tax=Fusarium euwallaceae TaxID=1147111 RepID=A0A430M180_9HYPO|nr:hypothetical protein BHE90_003759 [Fusarium euwallaceae]